MTPHDFSCQTASCVTGSSVLQSSARAAVVVALLCTLSGCNYLIMAGYLIGGPPQLEPAFEKETKHSFTDKDVRVAVVVYADKELRYQYEDLDHLAALSITARLKQNHVDMINPERIRLWMEENPDWDTEAEIGAAFDATYLVFVDISHFSLYEENSRHLYRGRAEAVVTVYEMQADGEGEDIFSHNILSEYPLLTPRSASEQSYDSFRKDYLLRLSDEVGRLFYPYGSGDDVGSGS